MSEIAPIASATHWPTTMVRWKRDSQGAGEWGITARRLLSGHVRVDHGRWVVSGGIGCGKSAVRRLLDEAGFHTIDADSVGHEVLAEGGPAAREVARRWPQVVGPGGIDRAELAAIVFADSAALEDLEGITHPHIFGRIQARVQGIPDRVAIEIPLLDHELEGEWARVIVDCDDDVRLSRLTERGMEEDDAMRRMAAQPNRSAWLSRADVVIPNHGDIDELRSTVGRLLAGL